MLQLSINANRVCIPHEETFEALGTIWTRIKPACFQSRKWRIMLNFSPKGRREFHRKMLSIVGRGVVAQRITPAWVVRKWTQRHSISQEFWIRANPISWVCSPWAEAPPCSIEFEGHRTPQNTLSPTWPDGWTSTPRILQPAMLEEKVTFPIASPPILTREGSLEASQPQEHPGWMRRETCLVHPQPHFLTVGKQLPEEGHEKVHQGKRRPSLSVSAQTIISTLPQHSASSRIKKGKTFFQPEN